MNPNASRIFDKSLAMLLCRDMDSITLPIQMIKQANELVVFDYANPKSIINIVPELTRTGIESIDKKYMLMSEDMLRGKLKPGNKVSQLRLSFWKEYNNIIERRVPKLNIINVIDGICTMEFWKNHILDDPKSMAWIMTMPTKMAIQQEDMLDMGMHQMRAILEAPIYKEDGNLNTQLVNAIIKIVQMLDQRVTGAITQKIDIQQKTVNLTKHLIDGDDPEKSMKLLENRLSELNKEIKERRRGKSGTDTNPCTKVIEATVEQSKDGTNTE